MPHCHFSLPFRFLLKDTDINCTSNSVHICATRCQPLPVQALRFAQHNQNMFQRADCMHRLVLSCGQTSFNSPATVVQQQALSVCRTRSQSPKTACPKMLTSIHMTSQNIAYTISHVNTMFLDCFMGGCQPWPHFQDSRVPSVASAEHSS
jgi:hypothetical protein